MAITFTNLGASAAPDFANKADATSYSTASWTPPTSGLIILFAENRTTTAGGTTPPPVPSVSGNSLTWVQIDTQPWFVSSANFYGRLTLFAANASGSSTGATTFDFSGDTQVRCDASFFLAEGVDLSGGVAAAFVQTVKDEWTDAPYVLTLASASHADNRPISGWAHGANEVINHRANWTEMDDLGTATPNTRLETQVRSDTFETTASMTNVDTTADAAGIAAELKATVSGGATAVPVFYHHLQQQGVS